MKVEITVREYARLTTHNLADPTLDQATITASAFDWLCDLSSTFSRRGTALLQIEGRKWLKLDNYVGVIETPCGTRIEILPKHVDDGDRRKNSRKLLQRMISTALDLPVHVADETSLQLFDTPLTEWVMSRFLASLYHLIKRGMKFDYVRIESNERYLRGQLDVVRQMRQPPGCQHIFQIRHDMYVPDRPENRLLKSALEIVCKSAQRPESWRLAHELRTLLQDVPYSADINADFKQWRKDRLMAHYQPVRPWCELVLYRQMPFSQVGQWRGISMLFPMEKLFERYVAASLRSVLPANARIITQAASEWLCFQEEDAMFRLRPDILIELESKRWVLDTKWKRIDQNDRQSKYQISQTDFYQMFAYGHRYLIGSGDMALIYPLSTNFSGSIKAFNFDSHLRVHVLAFDLEANQLIFDGQDNLPFLNSTRVAIPKCG